MDLGAGTPDALPAGVPTASLELAQRYVEQAQEPLERLTGQRRARDAAWLRRQLLLPLLLEPDWPPPRAPRAVGAGAVHADLIDEDVASFERLLSIEPSDDPEQVAASAQQWRLPVVPYRPRPPGASVDAPGEPLRIPRERPAEDLHIVDLSALWAGPLASGLLREVGIRVTKIDPSCRPDGFRQRPDLYAALNAGKSIVDLDLRRAEDRARFEDLVAHADLVIDSFSRRVMPNFGYGPEQLRRLNPQLATLSIAAFPAESPERDWLAYGAGVHAASGLGMRDGRPEPTPVAYPDALTGLRVFGIALGLLGARGERAHVDLSLLGSIAPLLSSELPS